MASGNSAFNSSGANAAGEESQTIKELKMMNKSLLARVDSLAEDVKTLRNSVKGELQSVKSDIQTIKNAINGPLGQRILSIEAAVRSNSKDIGNIEDSLATLEGKFDEFESKLEEIERTTEDLDARVGACETN